VPLVPFLSSETGQQRQYKSGICYHIDNGIFSSSSVQGSKESRSVKIPTLLLVGGNDPQMLGLNENACRRSVPRRGSLQYLMNQEILQVDGLGVIF
jgi:hypothetical protein